MAEPIGDDETYRRGMEKARAALGRPVRPRPVAVPDPPPVAEPEPDPVDPRDARIAALEVEVRRLRAALARAHDELGRALDD